MWDKEGVTILSDRDKRQYTEKNRLGWRELGKCEITTYFKSISFLNLQYMPMITDGKALIYIVSQQRLQVKSLGIRETPVSTSSGVTWLT